MIATAEKPAFQYNDKQKAGARVLSDPSAKFIKFYGSSRSGKTLLVLRWIRVRALKYAGSKHLVARYSFANAKKTIWLHSMLPLFRPDEKAGLCKINLSEGIIHYFNGSIIVLGGLEPARIDSILAAEYGSIFITEANENRWREVELLFSRMNDTSVSETGQMIDPKAVFDLNPTNQQSWDFKLFELKQNPESGQPLDNPAEYVSVQFRVEDNQENLSSNYIATLKNLSPSKRKRFYDGEYGSVDGLVYKEFNPDIHIVTPYKIPKEWKKYRGIDYGYVHPTACLWSAYDDANERLVFYREHRESRLTSQAQARAIIEKSRQDIENGANLDRSFINNLYTNVSDHQSEYRAGFQAEGIVTLPADKNVKEGINLTAEMLDKCRIHIFRDLSMLIDELFSYTWDEHKEAPVKDDDDLMDAMRYIVMEVFKKRQRKIHKGVRLT